MAAIALGAGAMAVGWNFALIPLGVAWIAVAGFFRDPLFRRPASDDPADLISPADGRVSAVLRLAHHPAIGGPALLVRIFLSVLDVHINRMPCACRVESIEHMPGRYLDARTEESARVNESNLVRLRSDDGEPLAIRQVSGAIARRIVCRAAPGDSFARGQRFGMIKFGSTTELIVDASAVPAVAVGDRVTGGVTILARRPSMRSS